MNAAVCGDTAQVKRILKGSLFSGGLNADAKDIAGFTAIIYACSPGNLDTERVLLDHGAKIDSSVLSGETALTTACRRNHTAVIKLLLEKGANVQATGQE